MVTVSFNQADFLRDCIESVLGQSHPDVEYILVDPGSEDGSREIVQSFGNQIIKVFEPDGGPADGLNKGFKLATGNILGYLNSDDILLPDALSTIASAYEQSPQTDVVCGHAYLVDRRGAILRRIYSDSFSLRAAAYGACVAVQPSTFFRSETYRQTQGFNVTNRSNWDGELLIDMALSGAKITVVNRFLSCYRVHQDSITGAGRLDEYHKAYAMRMFEKIMNRPFKSTDRIVADLYRVLKHCGQPRAAMERLRHGPVYRSARC